MKAQLPQYSGKDYLVMMGIVPVYTVFINYNIFGSGYFTDLSLFALATLISGLGLCIDFILCGYIAVAIKNRFPREHQLIKRLTIMILLFLLITGLFLYSLFQVYERYFFFNLRGNETGFIWSYFCMGIINVFLTFLMEGISRYQQWKMNWEETEQLKKAYQERQLLGLKSQVNQHFLFDGLHSLSGLIKQEGDDAEIFLNEMSRVYRYMLSVEDEQLVSLEAELKFIQSYHSLLKARHGEALKLEIHVDAVDRVKMLPPLSLQLIVENIVLGNELNPEHPMEISISSAGDDTIKITNTVCPKVAGISADDESGLNHLVNNYGLIAGSPMVVDHSGAIRNIHLPLLITKTTTEELI